MTLEQAKRTCMEIDGLYMATIKKVHWEEVYSCEQEIIEDLSRVYIPKNRIAPPHTFVGYDFIYSFAYYVQNGWKLSENQMRQCKRLATEIKKAAAICEYKF